MLKKMVMVIGTAALVAVLGLFAVGVASAQGPAPVPTNAPGTPWGQAWGRVCQGAGIVSEAVSRLLGMTPEQVYAERTAGKTLAQIAKEKGVTDQQLIDAIVAGREVAIAEAVKDGRLTQAQADWMLAKMKAMAPFQITNPFAPGSMRGRMGDGTGTGMRGRMGGGMRGDGRGPWATPSATPAQ